MTTAAIPRAGQSSASRALRLDLRLHSSVLLGTAVLSVVALVLAALGSDVLTGLATTWAALALCRHGRQDTLEAAQIRAGLGISKADALRGRVALVAIEVGLLIVVAALGQLLTAGNGSSGVQVALLDRIVVSSDQRPALELIAAIDTVLLWCCALVLTMLIVGRECLTRRPGRAMYLLSLLSFAGSSILTAIGGVTAALAAVALVRWSGVPGGVQPLMSLGATTIVLAATLAVLVAFLRRRCRRWILEL